MLGHSLEHDPGVERRAFDCGEELVLRGVGKVPAQSCTAEFRVDQHGPVPVVPC